MSDVVRTFSGTELDRRRRRRYQPVRSHKRGRGCLCIFAILVLIVAGCVWMTRDSHPVERLLPASSAYHIVAHDLLGKRDRLATSKVWQAFPSAWKVDAIAGQINQDLGAPDWLLNNLIAGPCHIVGNDLASFSDFMFATRMSRVGCFLARFSRLLPSVQSERAGGLNLRSIKGQDLFFAVRGRALLVSRSRDALVAAVTLTEEQSLLSASEPSVDGFAGEDVGGTLVLEPKDPAGNVFQSASFALRVEDATGMLKCRAALRPEWIARMGDAVSGLSPQALQAPPAGYLDVSANLGKSVRDLWIAAGQISGKADAMEALWTKISTGPWQQPVFAILSPLGPGIRLSWVGMDLNEMVPVPLLAATLDADPTALQEALRAIPAPPPDAMPWDMYLRYEEEKNRLSLPMVGGPSMQPTGGIYGESLLISSSQNVGEQLLSSPPPADDLGKAGNLWVRVHPVPCLKAISDVLGMFGEVRLVRDETMSAFETFTKSWFSGIASVDEVTGLAAYENGQVTLEIGITCAASQ